MMKKLPFWAALLLLCQGCDTNAPQLAALRTENHELKVRLAALGQDTLSEEDKFDKAFAGGTATDSTAINTPAAPTSMWKVRHYVNDFGDETKEGYITNESPIVGTFSNSATQDSPLLVKFLFDKDQSMSIQLYEYAGNNPVKAYGSDDYSVKVKDKDGQPYRLSATNYESDRMTLDKASSKRLNAALLKGGRVQFVINEVDTRTTEYHFTLDNADGYLAAREELTGKK